MRNMKIINKSKTSFNMERGLKKAGRFIIKLQKYFTINSSRLASGGLI